MIRDMGARDEEFLGVVADIRKMLLDIAGVSEEVFDVILLQGSGTYGVEAVLGTAVPRHGKVLIVSNGAYGARMVRMCAVAGIDHCVLQYAENEPVRVQDVDMALMDDPAVTHVAVVHLETTSGIVNPVEEVGAVASRHEKNFIVDAMCSFGGMPLDPVTARMDWLISSANKCLEGVPGFTLVLARLDALRECQGRARSLSLDLHDQWDYFRRVGQFRFTPPVQAMLAFHQALIELVAEGGVSARFRRYQENRGHLMTGMREMGFAEYVPPGHQGDTITTFLYPDDPAFDFSVFYHALSRRGYDIYAGKVAAGDCFRIGNIGRIFPEDIENLLAAMRETLRQMGIRSLNL